MTINSHSAAGTDGSVNFSGATSTINADNAVTFDRSLNVTAGAGTITFGGNVGVSQPLFTFGAVSNTAINLNAATFNISDGPGGAFSTMTGPTVLGNNVTFNTHGVNDNNVHFFGAVDADNAGAQDRTLTVTAGAATAIFSGPVGFSQPLADLDVTAGLIRFNTTSFNVSDGVGGARRR